MDSKLDAVAANQRLFCILVTYRRPTEFSNALDFVLTQDRPPNLTVVVDNEGSADVTDVVTRMTEAGASIKLLQPGENLGPAGGTAVAMEEILRDANDEDWITRIDDDVGFEDRDLFSRLLHFATEQHAADPRVAGVGAVGSRYDWRRGRLIRIEDEEIDAGPVDVDYLPTNLFPIFSVEAVRDVGVFDRELFYGSSEVEYGLRLRRAGYRLVADPVLWRRIGRGWGATAGPSRRLRPYGWRRYYSLRNQVHVLRKYGHPVTAVRIGIARGLLKPLANLPLGPGVAFTHLKWNSRAVVDGWRGRMGRTYDPEEFSI